MVSEEDKKSQRTPGSADGVLPSLNRSVNKDYIQENWIAKRNKNVRSNLAPRPTVKYDG
jgi:hypothetical protein